MIDNKFNQFFNCLVKHFRYMYHCHHVLDTMAFVNASTITKECKPHYRRMLQEFALIILFMIVLYKL